MTTLHEMVDDLHQQMVITGEEAEVLHNRIDEEDGELEIEVRYREGEQ